MTVFGFDVEAGYVITGALTGMAYGLLGIGLVLVYRATKVINFAHGAIGSFCATVMAKLVLDHHWPWPAAAAVAVVTGAGVGAAWERVVLRRLFSASRLILLVVTVGIAQVMLAAEILLPDIGNPGRFPTLFDIRWSVFGAVLDGGHLMLVLLVPAIVAAFAWLLSRTSFGLTIRATADQADCARLAGIDVRRVSTAVWALSGALAAATFVLINPARGEIAGAEATAALGPGLLMRALAAGLVGRLVSFPQALVGGVALGIAEALLFVNVRRPGTVDAFVFVAVVALVLLRRPGVESAGSAPWALALRVRPVQAHLRQLWWVRRLPLMGMSLAAAVAVAAPLVLRQPSQHFILTGIVVFALAGVSVVVITGWAGQLSLAQFAFVGIGAVVTAGLNRRGVPFGFATVYATVAGVGAAVVVGGPALRIKGLLLAVTTLAFAIAAGGWLLPHSIFFGDDISAFVRRGELGPLNLSNQRTYYYVCLVVLAVTLVMISRLRRTGVGRRIVAVRENEAAAAAMTVSPTATKLGAFALSGGIAALAGALLAGQRVGFGAEIFNPEMSLQLAAMVIIGGLGSVQGAVLGAVFLVGIPGFFNNWLAQILSNSDALILLMSGGGLILVLVQNPGGLVQGHYRLRDALLRRAERRLGAPDDGPPPAPSQQLARFGLRRPASVLDNGAREVARPLRVRDLTVAFGGIVANREVNIDVEAGEVVGLIGTNGAGKSTLMNAISGFVTVECGVVEVFGQDVNGLAPHDRAALGVGRVFQDARLFGDLTVAEAVAVALEAREPTEFVPSLLAVPPSVRAERRKRATADELIDLLGLGRYANAFIAELSTGTRRFAELACLLAVDARLLLLDEPTAGVAQRETEQFGPTIKEVQAALGASILIIEHDIPLVMSISDRVYCLSAGAVIAEGPPEVIRHDPQVVASYLGTDERAVARSDAVGQQVKS